MTCEELDLYLADLLEDELAAPRLEALLTHVEGCENCRRELALWQEQEEQLRRYFTVDRERVAQIERPAPAAVTHRTPLLKWAAWAAAALVLVALGAGGWQVYLRTAPAGGRVLATVHKIEGRVQLLAGNEYQPLAPGAPLLQGQRLKVAEGGYAALEYPNGNLLEVRSGTQLALRETGDHTEVVMNRGQVWAHLKVKPKKPFVIVTERGLRAVATGTVYSVQEGVGQTLVAVAEGTVKVEAPAAAQVLVNAGEVYSTRPGGAAGTVRDLTAWSEAPTDLTKLTAEETAAETAAEVPLAAQSAEIPAVAAAAAPAATPAPPALGDLLDALPENTRALLEIHDWPALRAQFNGSAYAALANEPTLRQWWMAVGGAQYLKEFMNEIKLLEVIEIAKELDGQVILALMPGGDVLLLADCRNHEREIRERIERLFAGQPAAAPGAAGAAAAPRSAEDWRKLREQVVLAKGRLIIAGTPALARTAVEAVSQNKPTPFRQSGFYRKVAANVKDRGFTAAVNMDGIWSPPGQDKSLDDTLSLLGLRRMDALLVAPGFSGQGGMNQAARLLFSGDRFGATNWLAEPGPMRGYDFFSPDVAFFVAARVRSPRQMFFDYLLYRYASQGEDAMRQMRTFFTQHEALFDSFGGEVAIGIDYPLIPIPDVKIAIELANREAFESQLTLLLQDLTDTMTRQGRAVSLQEQDYKGFKIHTLAMGGVPLLPSWAFVEDFVVIGPGPLFVQNSIDVHLSGVTIGSDTHLTTLFPTQAGTNFSLLIYQDVVKAIPGLLKNTILPLTGGGGARFFPDLSFMERYRAPGIAYANANPRSIDLFLNTPTGIDLNMGLTVPLVANWLAPKSSTLQMADKYAEAVVGLNQMAAAAEQYKKDNGRYPNGTGELKQGGKYLKEIPRDPFSMTGEALKMTPQEESAGLLLYSIGPDGVDQKGQMELKQDQKLDDPGDIVVRVPGAK